MAGGTPSLLDGFMENPKITSIWVNDHISLT
jgi:hypothetical protein